jgi:histidine decarboxylase
VFRSSAEFDHRAIGPFDSFCDGYGRPGARGLGYVCVLKLATALAEKRDDALLDGIVALDRAEAAGAYLGQVNIETASSFCGLAGQVWGHDLATAEAIATNRHPPLFSVPQHDGSQHDGSQLPIHDGQPLLEAGEALFGTVSRRRFPLAPGAHVICANRSVTAYRPRTGIPDAERGQAYGAWCYLALSIARERDAAADLFMEDAGLWSDGEDGGALAAWPESHRRCVVDSIVACGSGQGVAFERTYISYAYTLIPPGHLGVALAAAPCIVLARRALPGGDFGRLYRLTLGEWERQVGFSDGGVRASTQ